MKKILAVIMTIVMAFSIAAVPASAADVTVDDVFNALETSIDLIEDTVAQIHNIVGQVMAVLGKECAFCGAIHEIKTEAGADDEVVELQVVEAA